MRLQARSEQGIKTLMDEKQSKNDEFSFHLDSTKTENVTRRNYSIFEFDKPYLGGDIGKGTFVGFRQLFDVI